MPPNEPYVINGTVYQNGGVTPSSGTTVVLVHEPSGETMTITTNSLGQYILDMANLTSYSDGDYFKVVAQSTTSVNQDLRLKIISRSIFQISELKVKYKTD